MDLLDFSFAEFSNVEHCAVLRQASISESVQAANFENPYRGLASCFCGQRLGNPAVTRPVSVAFFWTLRADCSFSIYEENWRRNFASEQLISTNFIEHSTLYFKQTFGSNHFSRQR